MAESSATWSANPQHKRELIMQHALPQLLFRRCHVNCVDSDSFAAETPAEVQCIKNCQDKVYSGFNLYMGLRSLKESAAKPNVDVAGYVGFETEHSNDTSGTITDENHKTVDIRGIKSFTARQRRELKPIRDLAHAK